MSNVRPQKITLRTMPLSYSTHDAAAPEALSVVDAGLDEFNLAESSISDVRRLCVFAKNEDALVVGGAVGRTWGQCCELQQLWVHPTQRGSGAGTDLMNYFEAEAVRRGCTIAYLETFSFQAPNFYFKRDYQVVHETHGFTNGIVKYAMQKKLVSV